MLITYKWLKEFVDIQIPVEELAEKMTMQGLEVVAIKPVGIHPENEENIQLGKVQSVESHPKGDRLHVCKVHTKKGNFQVVTNSARIEKGAHVAIAVPGTKLPNGTDVTETIIKGVESHGMLIPRQYLNLEHKSSDIWILSEQEKKAKEEFKVYAEADYVMEIELTANRSDCLSIIGVAREVSAMLDVPLKSKKPQIEESLDEEPNVQIMDKGACPRYSARIVRGITVAPSPDWIKRRLELCGIRSINNIVDATNYVLLEYGHPTHAFDLNRLNGERVIARKAKPNEKITTLDDLEYELDENMLVIADEKEAVALAGVMGGANSEIIDASRNLLLESAFFDPISIRSTSKKLGIKTESSYRFDRTADWGIPPVALDRVIEIILLSTAGRVSRQTDLYVNIIKDKAVGINADYVSAKLGIDISLPEIEDILKRLGFSVMIKREDSIEVKVPTFRSDIARPIDLVEEIARIHGYNNIPETLFTPKADMTGILRGLNVKDKIREVLIGAGFTESYYYSFTNKEDADLFKFDHDNVIALGNPLTNDSTHLRSRIYPGLIKTVNYNVTNAYRNNLRFFELGHVFRSAEKEMNETEMLGMILFGENYDYYSILGMVELLLKKMNASKLVIKPGSHPFLHPVNSAEVFSDNESEIGFIGEIHPEIVEALELKYPVYVAELNVDVLNTIYNQPLDIRHISRFPTMKRDISLLVEQSVLGRDIINALQGYHEWLTNVNFVDLFTGEGIGKGKKSLTLSMTFQHPDRTLTEEDVNKIMDDLMVTLKKDFKVELR